MAKTSSYVPGVCNINQHEVSIRRMAGWLGVAIFVIWVFIMLLVGLSRWWHLVLIVPAFLAASGFLQAKNHFCTGYGRSGKQNAKPNSKLAVKVTDADAIKQDKAKTRQINLQTMAIATIVALLSLLIPASF